MHLGLPVKNFKSLHVVRVVFFYFVRFLYNIVFNTLILSVAVTEGLTPIPEGLLNQNEVNRKPGEKILQITLSERTGCVSALQSKPPNRVSTTDSLSKLRQMMIARNISAYIIPNSDDHQVWKPECLLNYIYLT